MKPNKPVKLNPKNKNYNWEIIAVLAEVGLCHDCPKYPEILYFSDTKSNRKFRILEDGYIYVSDDEFDRWANSSLTAEKVPSTGVKLKLLVEELRVAK